VPHVSLDGVAFAHADRAPILSAADLRLDPGWTAVVGENGAGKTTLLRLVAGELAPDEGRVRLEPPGARVALCPQEVGRRGADVESLASREDGEARRLRSTLELDPVLLARWETLSPGERRRWQIGAALALEPDVLLLDEPTNHADAEGRAVLAAALRRFRGVGVLVSHDRALLEGLCTRTLRLHRGAARLWPLPYGAARGAWEAEADSARAARSAAQERVREARERLGDARRTRAEAERARSGRRRELKDRDARAMGAKTVAGWAEARLGREVARLRAATERAATEVPEAPAPAPGTAVFLGWERAPRPTLLSLERDDVRRGDRIVLSDVAVRLGREDRIRVHGRNGAGKSSLLAALLAASTLPPDRVLHLPQELEPGEGVRRLEQVRALEAAARGRVLSLVAALGTDPARLLASRAPSPGEARKLLLALGLGTRAWALVLDEPTNHLDLPTVERLEEALRLYPGALLLVTHDDTLAAGATRSVWHVSGGRVRTG
jgi:ATPase subunit of ABC transporter with duplicated ATPase domains